MGKEVLKFYTIYKIINLINGKFYIGAHKTKNINDNYMGSGIGITRAIKKYGIENFDKEILYVLESEEEMYALEKEIVNEEFKKRDDTYNDKIGGTGGWDHIDCTGDNNCMRNKEVAAKVSISLSEKYKNDEEFAGGLRERGKLGTAASAIVRKGTKDSEETKTKRVQSWLRTIRSAGDKYKLISPSGEIFLYATLAECHQTHGLSRATLSKYLNLGPISSAGRQGYRASVQSEATQGWMIEK